MTRSSASRPPWATAIARAADARLPGPGERVAVIGCGSSLNVSRAYARLREDAGHGVTDAYPASELTGTRAYDHMVFVSRTGSTSEVLAALREVPAGVVTTSITAEPDSPLARQTGNVVLLDFAAERAVVSSQFISSAIVTVRAHLGEDLGTLPLAAAAELARPLPAGIADRREFTFLGAGWASFVADEAALKLREASRSWAESRFTAPTEPHASSPASPPPRPMSLSAAVACSRASRTRASSTASTRRARSCRRPAAAPRTPAT